MGLCPGKICECLGKIHVVKEQLEYFCTSMTQRKQLSLFDCSDSASVAAEKRTSTASGSSLKYSKILQELFLIVKNHVEPKRNSTLCADFLAASQSVKMKHK